MKIEKIVSLSNNRTVAYEVLYQDFDGALSKEKVFCQMDEEGDLEVFLHHLAVLRQMARENRLPFPPRFFLNIKPSTLVLFWDRIEGELQNCPFGVVLELREDWINEKLFSKLVDLRSVNPFPLSLDDFGRHSSNLDRYVKLRPNFTKIDLHTFSGTSSSFLFLLLEALRNIRESVFIAEKVETEDHIKLIKRLGIDYAQGYLFNGLQL